MRTPAVTALQALLACAAVSALQLAHATRAGDMPPPTAEAVRRTAAVQSASSAAATAATNEPQRLCQGVVDALDTERGRVRIDGTWMRISAGETRVVRLGRVATSGEAGLFGLLRVGQPLRFTLLARGTSERAEHVDEGATLGLVYVP